MPLFRCTKCNTIENTALSRYWRSRMTTPPPDPLCSQCDPDIGEWHGAFPRKPATGMMLASDGFLYSKESVEQSRDRFVVQGITIVQECA